METGEVLDESMSWVSTSEEIEVVEKVRGPRLEILEKVVGRRCITID
jgi:hypothetical protein